MAQFLQTGCPSFHIGGRCALFLINTNRTWALEKWNYDLMALYKSVFIIIIVIIINSSHELSPRTLNSELDLDTVKANPHANYLGQSHFVRQLSSTHTDRQIDTHTAGRSYYPATKVYLSSLHSPTERCCRRTSNISSRGRRRRCMLKLWFTYDLQDLHHIRVHLLLENRQLPAAIIAHLFWTFENTRFNFFFSKRRFSGFKTFLKTFLHRFLNV